MHRPPCTPTRLPPYKPPTRAPTPPLGTPPPFPSSRRRGGAPPPPGTRFLPRRTSPASPRKSFLVWRTRRGGSCARSCSRTKKWYPLFPFYTYTYTPTSTYTSVITLRRIRRIRRVQRCNRFCNRAQGAHFCDAFDAFDAFDDATGLVTGHWVHISATRSTCSTTLIFQNHTNAELLVLVTPLHPPSLHRLIKTSRSSPPACTTFGSLMRGTPPTVRCTRRTMSPPVHRLQRLRPRPPLPPQAETTFSSCSRRWATPTPALCLPLPLPLPFRPPLLPLPLPLPLPL